MTPCPTAHVCTRCLAFLRLIPDVIPPWLCPQCGGTESVALQSLTADVALEVLRRESVQVQGPPPARAA